MDMCNLLVDEADLRTLEELDPAQSDGFRLCVKMRIPVVINFENERSEANEEEWLEMTILEKRKEGEVQNVKVELKSDEDLFLHLSHVSTVTSFENFKKKHNYTMKFKEFSANLVKIFQDTEKKTFVLNLNAEGSGSLIALQQTPYKVIQLIEINLLLSDEERVKQSVIFRFNYQNARLQLIEKRIAEIYEILQAKNHSLYNLIQRTVGNGCRPS